MSSLVAHTGTSATFVQELREKTDILHCLDHERQEGGGEEEGEEWGAGREGEGRDRGEGESVVWCACVWGERREDGDGEEERGGVGVCVVVGVVSG